MCHLKSSLVRQNGDNVLELVGFFAFCEALPTKSRLTLHPRKQVLSFTRHPPTHFSGCCRVLSCSLVFCFLLLRCEGLARHRRITFVFMLLIAPCVFTHHVNSAQNDTVLFPFRFQNPSIPLYLLHPPPPLVHTMLTQRNDV